MGFDPSGPVLTLAAHHGRARTLTHPGSDRPRTGPAASASAGAARAPHASPRDPTVRPRDGTYARARARGQSRSVPDPRPARLRRPGDRAIIPGRRGALRPFGVRGDRRDCRPDPAPRRGGRPDHRARRLRRGRRVCDRGARPGIAVARRQRRVVPPEQARGRLRARRKDGRAPRIHRHRPVAHRGLWHHRGRRGGRRARWGAGRDRLGSSRSPRRRRAARCPIVHPAVCGYPCPELCGTGVAFKLAQALGAADRRGGSRAGCARDGRRPDAAPRREPGPRARGPARARQYRQARVCGR